MGFVPPKKYSWRPYTGSLHHVNMHLSYSAQSSTLPTAKNGRLTKKSQHQESYSMLRVLPCQQQKMED